MQVSPAIGEDDQIPCGCFERTMGPLIMSMRGLGLYHDGPATGNAGRNRDVIGNVSKEMSWRKVISFRTYSAVVVVLLWTNAFRSCGALLPNDSGFTLRASILVWCCQCASSGTIMFFACQRQHQMPEFLRHWKTLFTDCMTKTGSCTEPNTKRYVRVATVVAWLIFMTNIVGVFFILYADFEATRGFKLNYIKPFPECTATVILCSFLHSVASGAWIFPVVLVLTTSNVTTENFTKFAEALGRHIRESVGVPSHLKCFRRRHLRLCQSVAILDRMFRHLLAVCFGSNVLLACFLLYQLINATSMDTMNLIMVVFWLVTVVCFLLAAAISSAKVNDAAHSPLDHVFEIETRGANIEDIGQLNLFLVKLTGTTVGFTVLGMVVITKEFLLTITGVFMTYFFVLIQFKFN